MTHLLFVTGGARSGKSDYALNRAESFAGSHCFIATCPVIDPEMEERIRRHKAERLGGGWYTIEEERDLAATIQSLPPGTICLVDCITLWVNNLMYDAETRNTLFGEDEMQREVKKLLQSFEKFDGKAICVSNEVGMGIVPDNVQARRYRDLVGRANRMIAEAANEVVLVSCGLPLYLKK